MAHSVSKSKVLCLKSITVHGTPLPEGVEALSVEAKMVPSQGASYPEGAESKWIRHCPIEVRYRIRYFERVNSNLIRERLNRDTNPFVLRLSDGTRVPVAHPDFAAVAPGQVVVIDAKTGGVTRIDPLHVVAIEEKKSKTNGRHSH
jgi:hypothetical protein